MDPDMVLLECEEHMHKTIDYLKTELRGVRTGRASVGLIEHVKVDCYGSLTELRSLAALSTPEPTQIVVKPFDPGTVVNIVKAIERADLGLNPQSDGKTVRVPVPALSGERRKQLANQVRNMGETAKVSVRNSRRQANKQIDTLEKDKSQSLSEDQAKKLKDDVQELIKKIETAIDEMVTGKINEISEI
ncbi:MAG: ribosome recycling factor [Planctomycetes bacterium]|nr:ribosome recycling factor [Planctomycetota bacterium]NOG54129.1 ribosome recycling factor [Planctomycetota bacterium]